LPRIGQQFDGQKLGAVEHPELVVVEYERGKGVHEKSLDSSAKDEEKSVGSKD